MSKYGQFCPVAKALEILGDRWTLLIIRDMLGGTTHFNKLERGLPGISRALLARRLKQLQQAGVIEKRYAPSGRKTTEYQLTQAGRELEGVIGALVAWGDTWAFGEPAPEELDPVLLMWWTCDDVRRDRLPESRVVVQYDFRGMKMRVSSFWLVLTAADVTLCLTDPGYEIDLLVTADVAALYKLYWGLISYDQALSDDGVTVEGLPGMVRDFPGWFAWRNAEGLRAVRAMHEARLLLTGTG